MAVSINKVYQKVLALTNKEQRGYITPQEFNLFADHAQMDIFEQYFYDLEQRQRGIGNESDYMDIISNIDEKLDYFKVRDNGISTDATGVASLSTLHPMLHTLGLVRVNNAIVEKMSEQDYFTYSISPLAKPSKSRPVYVTSGVLFSAGTIPTFRIQIFPFPTTGDTVNIDFIRRPSSPKWTYVTGTQGTALYNPGAGGHQDFELHSSEESKLVIKILQLAGVAIKDFNLVQVAAQEEVKNIQQEKQ